MAKSQGFVLNALGTYYFKAEFTPAAGTYWNGSVSGEREEPVLVLSPDTEVTITPDVWETEPGGNVILTVEEKNTGDCPLDHVQVTLRYYDAYGTLIEIPLDKDSLSFQGDTTGIAGQLDPGETWTWILDPIMLYVETEFTVDGYGKTVGLIDPLTGTPYEIDFDHGYSDERASAAVEVGGATRTWGFWKTHLWLAEYMLGGSTELDPSDPYYTDTPIVTLPIDLGTWLNYNGVPQDQEIGDICRYMGLMWNSQTQNSDGTKRTAIDAVRMHTAHQALAAIMNSYMPGGAPLPAGITLESIAEIMTNGTIEEIRSLGSQLAAYNESGDGIALDPSLPPTGHTNGADPQGARETGSPCEAFWDTPPETGAVPAISITAPTGGDTVTGTDVTVTASVVYGGDIEKVEFYADGTLIGTDTNGADGWSCIWDSTTVPDDIYSITAIITTADSITVTSAAVSVEVDNVVEIPATYSVSAEGSAKVKGKWTATATVTLDPTMEGAVVTGIWSNGVTVSGTISASGTCVFTMQFASSINSVTFTVENISLSGYTFTPNGSDSATATQG
jgi:hypothetical protein